MQKLRDIFKNASIKYTGKSYVVLIGVENQSDIHYAIPVKNMFYDVMAYGKDVYKRQGYGICIDEML